MKSQGKCAILRRYTNFENEKSEIESIEAGLSNSLPPMRIFLNQTF